MKKEVGSGKGKSFLTAVCMGNGIGMLVILLGAVIAAWLIDTERIEESAVDYGALVITILATFMSCVISIKKAERNRLAVSACASALLIIVLLSINALFFDGLYKGISMTILVVMATGLSAAIIGINKIVYPKKHRKHVNR